MIKFVLRDYRQTLKEGLVNLISTGRGFVVVYLLGMIWPLYEPKGAEWMLYYCDMLPLAFAVMLTGMYPNRLSKTFFLCPMSLEQRKQYIRTGFWLRTAGPMGVYVILNGVALLLGKITWISYLAMLPSLFLAIVAQNLWFQANGEDIRIKQKLSFSYYRYQACYMVTSLLGIFTVVLLSLVKSKIDTASRWEDGLIFGLVLLQCVLTGYEMKMYFNKVLAVMADYEKAECLETKKG